MHKTTRRVFYKKISIQNANLTKLFNIRQHNTEYLR